MEAKQAEQLRNAYAGLANLRGPVADAINQATEEYANARTAAEKTAAKRNAVERVRAALSQTLGGGKETLDGGTGARHAPDEGTRGTEAAGSAPEVKPEVMPSAARETEEEPAGKKNLFGEVEQPKKQGLFNEPTRPDVKPRAIDKDKPLRDLSAVQKRDVGAWDMPQMVNLRSGAEAFLLRHIPTGNMVRSDPLSDQYVVTDRGSNKIAGPFASAEEAAKVAEGKAAGSAPLRDADIPAFLARNDLTAFRSSLGDDDRRTLDRLQGVTFALNNKLRKGNAESSVGEIKKMDDLILRSPPLKESATVLRGLNFDSPQDLAAWVNGVVAAKGYHDKGYTSTSLSSDYGEKWGGEQDGRNVIAEVRLPVGTRGAYLGGGAEHLEHEKELLLPRGGDFKLIGVEDRPGHPGDKKVVLEYTGSTPDELPEDIGQRQRREAQARIDARQRAASPETTRLVALRDRYTKQRDEAAAELKSAFSHGRPGISQAMSQGYDDRMSILRNAEANLKAVEDKLAEAAKVEERGVKPKPYARDALSIHYLRLADRADHDGDHASARLYRRQARE